MYRYERNYFVENQELVLDLIEELGGGNYDWISQFYTHDDPQEVAKFLNLVDYLSKENDDFIWRQILELDGDRAFPVDPFVEGDEYCARTLKLEQKHGEAVVELATLIYFHLF